MIEIKSDAELTEIQGKGGLVLVDVYAPWCGPCKMVTPALEELEKEYDGVTFVKVNADEVKDVTESLDVMSIPTIFTFNGVELLGKTVGFQPKEKLAALLDRALSYKK